MQPFSLSEERQAPQPFSLSEERQATQPFSLSLSESLDGVDDAAVEEPSASVQVNGLHLNKELLQRMFHLRQIEAVEALGMSVEFVEFVVEGRER